MTKPFVLTAMAKDLHGYLRKCEESDRQVLSEANERTLKILMEINSALSKLD